MGSNKEYMLVYMRERREKRRKYIHEKLGNKCIKCGSVDNLQFDHIDRFTKKMLMADILSHSLDKLEEELKKCQLLCQKCHTEKTMKEMGWRDSRKEHGTPRSYLFCHCNICRDYINKKMREYKANRKHKCLDCDALVSIYSERCRSCNMYFRYRNNPL